MLRALLFLMAAAVFAPRCRAEAAVSNPETRIDLSVTPEPAPKPALRYLLLPDLREMNPGNPILNYMKAMMAQQSFFFDKEAFERREKLLAMPLKELPANEVEEYGRSILSQVDRAARLDTPDWQILLKMRSDGFGTLLPEVQQIRGVARALRLRFRAEVALSRFDDGIRTAKTLFAISRHLSEHPTLIGDLVGLAIASVAIEPLEEMLAQPGCPNLYWALTSLPHPLVPIAKGLEGERMAIYGFCGDVIETAPMTPDQIKKFIDSVDKAFADGQTIKPGARAWLDARTKRPGAVQAARRRLAEYGIREELLSRFAADQVILLDEKRELEVRLDDFSKTMIFPPWQGEKLAAQVQLNAKKEPAFLADQLLPAIHNVRMAQGRVDQRIALLRHVEAVRLHAAEHKGSLPARLSEISVPLPDDPFTGKPFRYELTGSVAHIRGTPPKAMEKIAQYNIHYVVTIQKQ